ncbi:MAG TPA: FkbM family methyltransferase [Candidatus Paceibacterota bacterium]
MLLKIKRLLNKFGYDIKKYRPTLDTTIRPLNIRTIIDIGANTGHYAKEMRALFPDAAIYSFEPLKDCFKSLEASLPNDAKFKAFNTALGDTKGSTTIERSSFHPSSSLLVMSDLHKKLYPKSKDSTKETISIERLDDVLKDANLEPGIFIKMDVQGFEDKVILGGKETVKKASAVVIETSYVALYEKQPLFDDIYKLMTGLGFAYYGDMARHYSKDTDKLIYEDSLFVRKDLI